MMDASSILLIQAIYYYITALWPLIHSKSFMAVTGPKTDVWLVKTVSVMILAAANTFLSAVLLKDAESTSILCLSVSCCTGLLIIDIYYVARKVISRIYLLDAVAELLILAAWMANSKI